MANDILNNMEKYLLENGVPTDQVEKIKMEKTISVAEFDLYYDLQKEGEISNVPVERIKATSGLRGAVGETWFNIAANRINLDSRRLENCLGFLMGSKDLASYFNFFESELCLSVDPLSYDYYDKDDIYRVGTGNHRTIAAKLTGAPFIKAPVDYYKLNHMKYNNYKYLKKSFIKFDEKLEKYNFTAEINDGICGIYYKGNLIITIKSDHNSLFCYLKFKERRYRRFKYVIDDVSIIDQMVLDLNYLQSKINDIIVHSQRYKRVLRLFIRMERWGTPYYILLLIHYFDSKQDEFVANSALLVASKDLSIDISNRIEYLNFL